LTRLLSPKVSRRLFWACFDEQKLELALASLVLIAKCIHLWSHMAWISPFACLFRSSLELLTDFRPLTQQSAFPSCFAPLQCFMGCDWLCTQLPALSATIKRLHLGSLDRSIGHIALRLSPCPATCTTRLSLFPLYVKT
jgi:hypothetical protein